MCHAMIVTIATLLMAGKLVVRIPPTAIKFINSLAPLIRAVARVRQEIRQAVGTRPRSLRADGRAHEAG